ncbi:MAG: hypothetical protein JW731_10770, partial [Bacteroidales bacterium]|nr:hypothetical protein [Bacteroidales bacterium]
MPTQRRNKVPRFFGFRIYLSSIIIYYWLVLPFIFIISIKYSPDFRQRNKSGFIEFNNNSTGVLADTINKTLSDYLNNKNLEDSLLTELDEIDKVVDSAENLGPTRIE